MKQALLQCTASFDMQQHHAFNHGYARPIHVRLRAHLPMISLYASFWSCTTTRQPTFFSKTKNTWRCVITAARRPGATLALTAGARRPHTYRQNGEQWRSSAFPHHAPPSGRILRPTHRPTATSPLHLSPGASTPSSPEKDHNRLLTLLSPRRAAQSPVT